MRRFLPIIAVLGLLLSGNAGHAQEKLKTDGYGSVSGKVTLDGNIPAIVDLTAKLMAHQDKACCLDPKAKASEKIDQTWVVDPKTKAVKNVMVWVSVPKDTYLEVPAKYKKRKDKILIDQPHCAFLERVYAYNPVYFDGKELVATGQTLIIRNSAVVSHNVRVTGHPLFNPGFNKTLAASDELNSTKDAELKDLKAQPLPISLQCDLHTWMASKLFVFDHPFYALTKADGTFEIKDIPAGAEVRIVAWHEGVGWALKEGKMGRAITIEKGKKHTLDIDLKAP